MTTIEAGSILARSGRRALITIAWVALALLGFSPTLAQDQAPPRAPDWAGIAPEMKRLHVLSGLWRHEIEVFAPKKAEWRKAGVFFGRYDLKFGGYYVEGTFSIPLGGEMGFTNSLILSYDKFRKVYRMVALEDVVGIADLFIGNFEGETLVLSNQSTGTYGPNMRGELEPVRIGINFKGGHPSSMHFEAFRQGNWVPMMRFTLSKALD